jgi:hypothetical protein
LGTRGVLLPLDLSLQEVKAKTHQSVENSLGELLHFVHAIN